VHKVRAPRMGIIHLIPHRPLADPNKRHYTFGRWHQTDLLSVGAARDRSALKL